MTDRLLTNLRTTIREGSLVATPLPLCPDISLYLIGDDYPRSRLPDEEMLAIMDRPAYWAFCWASGQVLAAYLLANPALCQGRKVLDLGAGSGVVAIAAAMAGATEAVACDLDAHALAASIDNAHLNGVRVSTLEDLNAATAKYDLLVAADVLYDRENIEWLEKLEDYADEILVADSRIRDRSVFRGYDLISELDETTIPALDELKEFGHVSVYRRQKKSSSDRA
jgi:predicted nicotinamide N-methyase